MLSPRRAGAIAGSIARRLGACKLQLEGGRVITEIANDAFGATAVGALLAGAEVWGLAKDCAYATADEAEADVRVLAKAAGADVTRLHVLRTKEGLPWGSADVVTNSGHLRPIDGPVLAQMRPGAAIALMFEPWELRDGDIDVAASRSYGIPIAGVNEHHAACGAFEFVGEAAIAAALGVRWSIRSRPVAVVSDGPFAPPVIRALLAHGADVRLMCPDGADAEALTERSACRVIRYGELTGAGRLADVAILAVRPPKVAAAAGGRPTTASEAAAIVAASGAYGCVQLWGDIDRIRLKSAGVAIQPAEAPLPGHMGVRLDAAGFEPVVRLLVCGLAAAASVAILACGQQVVPGLAVRV